MKIYKILTATFAILLLAFVSVSAANTFAVKNMGIKIDRSTLTIDQFTKSSRVPRDISIISPETVSIDSILSLVANPGVPKGPGEGTICGPAGEKRCINDGETGYKQECRSGAGGHAWNTYATCSKGCANPGRSIECLKV